MNTQNILAVTDEPQMSIIKEEALEDSIDEKMQEMGIVIPKKVEYKLSKKIIPKPREDTNPTEENKSQMVMEESKTPNLPEVEAVINFEYFMPKPETPKNQLPKNVLSKNEMPSFNREPIQLLNDNEIESRIIKMKEEKFRNIIKLKNKIKEKKIKEQAKRDFEILDPEGEWTDL